MASSRPRPRPGRDLLADQRAQRLRRRELPLPARHPRRGPRGRGGRRDSRGPSREQPPGRCSRAEGGRGSVAPSRRPPGACARRAGCAPSLPRGSDGGRTAPSRGSTEACRASAPRGRTPRRRRRRAPSGAGRCPRSRARTSGWSWRFRPTPGSEWTVGMPWGPSTSGSPTPERRRIAGDPYVPAARTVALARTRSSSPSRHATTSTPSWSGARRSQSARSTTRRLGRPRAGSRYANAVLMRTPPSTLTGSEPKPTPPSRSSRSSARGRPSAAAASRQARWNGPISSSA